MTAERIRIALQKSGRMSEDSLALLKACGLHIAKNRDQLLCRVKELPIDILLVRDDDIPNFVASGICDLGIVGENVFMEEQLSADGCTASIVERLGFSRCRLSIAAPDDGTIREPADLNGKTIATTYPALLKRFARDSDIKVKILEMTGSVEVAPRLKIADAICDIVASGATLAANNLAEMSTILYSEALLIRSASTLSAAKEAIVNRLLTRMRGTIEADDSKYIMLHVSKEHLGDIIELLPGSESPTILPLQGTDS
ncbi:MAG TPA: ATP phosphoribosyltransferase, partial [Rhodospirillaceae bacterium]|nr:ATP phosphoribosyltransferase [Rhodospirillaceae bacterium]